MMIYLAVALISLAFALSSGRTEAADKAPPKECIPVLRIPPQNYVPFPELLSPPVPVGYSTYYYELYGVFCEGKPRKDCIWTCVPVREKKASVKAGF
jgi:hypothetical protein